MNKRKNALLFALCSLPAFALAAYFVSLSLNASGPGTAAVIALCLMFFCLPAFLVMLRGCDGRNIKLYVIVISAVYFLLLVRICCFDVETGDYQVFLKPWTEHFRENGGFAALSGSIGNYNIPYLTFLALFSYIPVSELYLIKLLSIGFELVLACSLGKLVRLCTGSTRRGLICFGMTMLLPTVFLNGAWWGQCDSIYSSLAVLSLYLILADKPWLSIAALGFSFAFKLQAVFIFPVYFVFLFTRRLKLRHLPVFPAAYILAVSPALIAGRPFMDTMLLYVSQGSTVGNALNYNSSSVFSLVKSVSDIALASDIGIIAAFVFCAVMFILLFIFRKRLNNVSLLLSSLIFVVAIPLLLPHMHDRYFFLADVLTFALAFVLPPCALFAPLASFASLLGYHAYLKGRYLLPLYFGFVALAIVLVCSLILLVTLLSHAGHDSSNPAYG